MSAMGSSKYEFAGSIDDDFHNRNVFYEEILSWPEDGLSDKERFVLLTSDEFYERARKHYNDRGCTFSFTREGLRDRAINEIMKGI
jgi:hypothetical protein